MHHLRTSRNLRRRRGFSEKEGGMYPSRGWSEFKRCKVGKGEAMKEIRSTDESGTWATKPGLAGLY